LAPKNFNPKTQLCNFWRKNICKNIGEKSVRKMLMKLTPAPSRMALATSEASALVQRGFNVMDSNICVAQITGLPDLLHFEMICF